ncbi:extracellular solute-binding protein [Flexivirga sp. ID2601S]|uniref:Extracellular solute-binding protein n=1 Tax=Flexivirga aerilata TaxID=1656889 RepID=A0A849AQP7_9MICO|nr:extracellular solute-binding protein [Flexivirga aerilata]NNG40610.1 extracellular solute-binding protein [Flexivirga aerilata]
MSVSRRQLLKGAVASAPLFALAACGSKAGQAGGGSAGLSAWALTGGPEQVFKDTFAAWNSANPDHKFTVQYFANDSYKQKIRTSVGSGNGPTLIYSWAGGTLKDYVASKDVVDLTDKIPNLTKRVIPSVLDVGKVDGKVYAVPINNSQPVLFYYNKLLFKQAGVQVPTTFGQLLSAVRTFKAKGILPIALAGQSQWPELMWIEYLVDRIGGPEPFKKVFEQTKGAWSDPAFSKAFEKLKQLIDAGAFGNRFGSVVADNNADAALVYTNKAAMLLQGSWVYTTFTGDAAAWVKQGNLGWFDFPTVEGGVGDKSDVYGNPSNYFSVSAKASKQNQDQAAKFLDTYNLNDKACKELIDMGLVPAVQNIEGQLAASKDKDFLEYTYTMTQNAKSFQLSWDQALSDSQAQTLLTKLSQFFLGQATGAQYIAAMNGTIK